MLESNFSGVNLSKAKIEYTDFQGSNFSNANLNNSEIISSNLDNCIFIGAELKDANFASMGSGGDRTKCMEGTKSSFKNANLTGTKNFNPENAILNNTILPDGTIANNISKLNK